jgi:hypothetical protein
VTRPGEITPEDLRRVNSFLDACEGLSAEQWEEICRRRKTSKRKILKADDLWTKLHLELIRPLMSTPRLEADVARQQGINLRMKEVAERFPDAGPWNGEKSSFPTLVRLAMQQAVMVLRLQSQCIMQPGAADAAATLTEAFRGIVDVDL